MQDVLAVDKAHVLILKFTVALLGPIKNNNELVLPSCSRL
jgi:hypothetical protein